MTGLPVALSRVWLAWCLAEGGVFSEAIVYGEEGIELAEIVDHPYSLIHACCGLGFVCLRQGDLPRAVGVLERAHTLAQTYAPVALPVTTAYRGYALALAGRGTEAVPLLEYAVEQSVATHLLFYYSLRVAWLGEALLLIGRMPEAADHAVRALGLSRERQEQGHEAWAVRLRGALAAPSDSPDVATAEIHDHHALTRAQTPGMRQLQTHCHRGLGALYGYLGRPAQARSALSAAIELDRTMSMTYWLLPAQATLAQSV
jgi:tetratricopeptide (TPR) repeat protein